MSVEKPNEVIDLSNKYADKVYVSLDIFKDNIMIKIGMKTQKENTNILIFILAQKLKDMSTDIQNDGMLKGLNFDFVNNFIKNRLIKNLIKKL